HGLRVGTLRDEQRSARVPQIMETQAVGQAGAAQRWAERPLIEEVVTEGTAGGCREDERIGVVCRVTEVDRQFLYEELREADRPARVGLRRAERELPVHL